ncbi:MULTISPECIES: IS6 family transposase [Haloferacaceae]|uniref:IS6 family transposase n=1 Tax=Halorubrum glutamatedens TaxID=2707018 RepID=A0ABD5QW90_9EURY|nr:IS6 family transposase [Halobellus captivus]
MPENDRLSGCLDEITVEFVEREATPRLLMKLSIRLYSSELSLSNTVSFLEISGVDRVRSTVHNWVHKADLQPETGRCPNHVAVDGTVIQLDDEHYWLYAAVDPQSNDPLHTRLEPTRNNAIADQFFAELLDKHDVDDATVLVDGAAPLQRSCRKHGLGFRYERHGNRNSVERVSRGIKRRTIIFSNSFSNAEAETADEWLRSFGFAWNLLI